MLFLKRRLISDKGSAIFWYWISTNKSVQNCPVFVSTRKISASNQRKNPSPALTSLGTWNCGAGVNGHELDVKTITDESTKSFAISNWENKPFLLTHPLFLDLHSRLRIPLLDLHSFEYLSTCELISMYIRSPQLSEWRVDKADDQMQSLIYF